MKKNKLTITGMLIIAIFAFCVSGCATYRMHPEFKERHKEIRSAAIMPPDIEIYQVAFRGEKTLLVELMNKLSIESGRETKDVFKAKGYVVNKLDLSEDVLSKDPSLRNAHHNVKELFKKAIDDISKTKKTKFTYDIGTEVNIFADMADADVLVFIKESGFKKTAGEIAKDVAKSILISIATLGNVYVRTPSCITVIQIAIVDSNTGDILWYNTNIYQPEIDAANVRHVMGTIRSLLRPFPNSVFKEKEPKKIGKTDIEIKSTLPKAEEPATPVPSGM